MIKKLNVTDPTVAQQVLNVQLPSYQVEAELINFQGIPRLHDTIENLLECSEIFLGYVSSDQLVGFISYTKDDTVLDIHRMAVHPSYFRKGIASSLISHLLNLESNMEKMIVCTGAKNTPAKILYQRFGFCAVEDREIAPGISLTFFERSNGAHSN
ncbi:GNAT family N-acetyltransferase [Risungbinella massiliensis]|uniref:GNAT family N-acetyltransferase n=1 Tax=Risungbinella massiliensis TaxID=1329796 RepID=UPI0005CC1151|nr:GNAT family N-acetyltransferase [Risungbinella massiliensis]